VVGGVGVGPGEWAKWRGSRLQCGSTVASVGSVAFESQWQSQKVESSGSRASVNGGRCVTRRLAYVKSTLTLVATLFPSALLFSAIKVLE
jgi:hypothetical protein